MGKKFKTRYQIPFYESDVNHNVKLPHILSVALQIASDQSVSLGLGDERFFKDYNLVWVVSEHEVMIDRLPRFNEIVDQSIKLWKKRLTRFIMFDILTLILMDMSTTAVILNGCMMSLNLIF